MLVYGAHLIKNGGAAILIRLAQGGWITHLATNGAGVIHDWEFCFHGLSTENVKNNVATGTFGAWDETGRNIHLALLGGALEGRGFGGSVGQFAANDGITLPSMESLEAALRAEPSHPLAPAGAELLQAMRVHRLAAGRHEVHHPWKPSCVLAQCFLRDIPLTVHPGIGYDIIANHPMFNGAAIGRAAGIDFRSFVTSAEGLDEGVVLSIGSAIMGPQVFEKSLSCVNNLRLQAGRPVVRGHSIYVVEFRMAAIGIGRKGSRARTIRPTICAFAKATRGWAARCATCVATTWLSSITCCGNWRNPAKITKGRGRARLRRAVT